MLIKRRKMTKEIKGLAALERRLKKGDENRSWIKEKIYNLEAGFSGESQYDKYLTEFKPRYPHAILHDVSLKTEDIYFQMDSILITPSFILITEVKNIAEKILIKANPLQFVKEFPTGKRTALRNPITEVERKIHLLENWLTERNIKLPVKGIIAFAYNNELQIEAAPNMEVMFTYDVPAYFRSLPIAQEILKPNEIRSVANEIYKNHHEFDPYPILTRYKINPAEIMPGVICSKCGYLKMKWKSRKWQCPACGYNGRNEHKNSIEDWGMLIKCTMTNREFRYFIQHDCRHVAKYLLRKAPTRLIGSGRNSYYEIQLDI